jgi:hypothetical protein
LRKTGLQQFQDRFERRQGQRAMSDAGGRDDAAIGPALDS